MPYRLRVLLTVNSPAGLVVICSHKMDAQHHYNNEFKKVTVIFLTSFPVAGLGLKAPVSAERVQLSHQHCTGNDNQAFQQLLEMHP